MIGAIIGDVVGSHYEGKIKKAKMNCTHNLGHKIGGAVFL